MGQDSRRCLSSGSGDAYVLDEAANTPDGRLGISGSSPAADDGDGQVGKKPSFPPAW